MGRALPGRISAVGPDIEEVAHLDALGGEDVALLPVDVPQKRDARAAVGVVLDGIHPGRDAALVALEIDEPVAALVPTADVAASDAAAVVAAARLA